MFFRRSLIVYLFLFLSVVVQSQSSNPPKIILGYYPSWAVYRGDYNVSDIAADKLTHISYAFANISEDLTCTVGDSWADIEMSFEGDSDTAPFKGNFHQLHLLKEKHPHLKTLIAVGGWSWSVLFSDAALTQESREKFVASCVKFMKDYGFDGIEMDWNFPTGVGSPENHETPEDPANYVLLLQEFRKQLDTVGTQDNAYYLLTIAAGAGRMQMRGIDWRRVQMVVDWINIMAYDFSGSWSDVTGFNAPLYYSSNNPPEGGSVNTAMVRYINYGVPRGKLVLGIPFYGFGWTAVPKNYNGLHQVPGSAAEDGLWEGKFYDYRDLVANYIPTMKRFWSRNSRVPWLYDETRGLMITYDDVESVTAKAAYVNQRGFGGVSIWDLSADTDNASLVTALWTTLTNQPSN